MRVTDEALARRRRLILGGLIGLLILFQAAAGLFALWHSHASCKPRRTVACAGCHQRDAQGPRGAGFRGRQAAQAL